MSVPQAAAQPAIYTAGATVRSSATFVNNLGALTDPTSVTATAIFTAQNPPQPPVTLTVIRDSTGLYHAEVTTSAWTGPSFQLVLVNWVAAGVINQTITDSFYVQATASSATDALGP